MTDLKRLHPSSLFLYFMTVILLPMFVPNPVIISFSGIGGLLCLLSVRKKGDKLGIVFYFILIALITLINPLFSHNGKTELFFINNSAVTLEALIYGAVSGGMIISVLIWFRSFSAVMTSEKLLYVLGRFVPKFSLILSAAFRYIPLFRRQQEKTRMTQTAMGLYKTDTLENKLKSSARIFSILTTWSFENAIDTADSMRARGYNLRKRTPFSIYKKRPSDTVFSLINIFLTTISITTAILGKISMKFYPEISLPKTNVWVIMCYLSYGFLAILPAILELKEAIKWKYLTSKI